jgi:hypothetical protein
MLLLHLNELNRQQHHPLLHLRLGEHQAVLLKRVTTLRSTHHYLLLLLPLRQWQVWLTVCQQQLQEYV